MGRLFHALMALLAKKIILTVQSPRGLYSLYACPLVPVNCETETSPQTHYRSFSSVDIQQLGELARYSWSDMAQQWTGEISDGLRRSFLKEATEGLDLVNLGITFYSAVVLGTNEYL